MVLFSVLGPERQHGVAWVAVEVAEINAADAGVISFVQQFGLAPGSSSQEPGESVHEGAQNLTRMLTCSSRGAPGRIRLSLLPWLETMCFLSVTFFRFTPNS